MHLRENKYYLLTYLSLIKSQIVKFLIWQHRQLIVGPGESKGKAASSISRVTLILALMSGVHKAESGRLNNRKPEGRIKIQ